MAGRDVDFVRPRSRDAMDAYECRWDADTLDAFVNAMAGKQDATPEGADE